MWLDDDRRLIEVSGDKQGHVDAVLILIVNELQKKRVWLGGDEMRIILFPVLPLFSCILAFAVSYLILMRAEIASMLAMVSFLTTLFLSPWWMHWFPGTVVYETSAPFMERYGLVLWVAGLALPSMLERAWRIMRRPRIATT
jgi:hypothetical protein